MELKDGIKQINQSVSQSSASDATLEGYMLELKDANGNLVDKQPVSKLESLVYNYLTTKRQSELAKVMSVQESLGGANDNVFIMFHKKNDRSLAMVKIEQWTAQQNSGETATGVAVVDGERVLVVAPIETSAYWSSAAVSAGGKTTTDRLTALGDFEGKANTAAQITHSEASGASYAPGYCAQYSRTDANGQGLTAGSWWLPSMGELMMIYANKDKINYALSLISGATQLAKGWYWSSTEENNANAWVLYNDQGHMRSYNKVTIQCRVRPVSSISLNLPSFYKDYENVGELATAVGGNQDGKADGFVKFINTFIDDTIDDITPMGVFPYLDDGSQNRGFVFRFFSDKHTISFEIKVCKESGMHYRSKTGASEWNDWKSVGATSKTWIDNSSLGYIKIKKPFNVTLMQSRDYLYNLVVFTSQSNVFIGNHVTQDNAATSYYIRKEMHEAQEAKYSIDADYLYIYIPYSRGAVFAESGIIEASTQEEFEAATPLTPNSMLATLTAYNSLSELKDALKAIW